MEESQAVAWKLLNQEVLKSDDKIGTRDRVRGMIGGLRKVSDLTHKEDLLSLK